MACNDKEILSGPLFVKRNAADMGIRPITPCTDFWLSPDVWLEGGIDAGTARVGVANTIRVRVRAMNSLPNGASTIENVNVQVWVSNYTLGVGPASGLPSAGGAGGLSGFIASVGAGSEGIATCGPWTPVDSDAQLNGGHVCLAVNCHADSPDTGTPVPPNSFVAMDGSSKVCCDSHLAQRNIGVRKVAAGAMMIFKFEVRNPDRERPLDFTVAIAEVRGPLRFPALERELLLKSPLIKKIRAPELREGFRLGLEGVPGKHPLHRARLRDEFGLTGPFGGGRRVRGRLKPRGRTVITIEAEIDRRERPGAVKTFELTQRNAKGDVIGGALLHALVF